MDDKDAELRRLIEGGQTAQGEPISKLGYFCAPFRPAEGPFSDKVIKVYRSSAGPMDLDRLADAHADYVRLLQDSGIRMPTTELVLLEAEGTRIPVILQDALPAESMMRPQIISASQDGALALLDAAGEVIATFWTAVAGRRERIGFHPSIRNLAVIDGEGIFFDTFPPLIGYSREEMGQVLILYSGSALMRSIGPLMKARITGIQDEWYSPPETLVGLVGSACRLRPADAEAFLAWGRDFVQRRMPDHADGVLPGLSEPPRLPGYWMAARRILGLQGEPNL
jgi:hypothetical protein